MSRTIKLHPSDSTRLVSGLWGGRGVDTGASGICFGEDSGLGPCGWRLDWGRHLDRLDRPEGAGDVPSSAGATLEGGLRVLEELSVQGAGGLRCGGHHRGGLEGLQGVQNHVRGVLDAALPF